MINTFDNPFLLFILGFFIALNLVAFFIMLVDKIKSTNPGSARISEGMMFFLAAAFGALGVYAGMFAFRHKTRKWYFLIGIPLLIIQNAATIYLLYLWSAPVPIIL
jgi:uncharacterized membrane protein YsdA (DUF1294 family)